MSSDSAAQDRKVFDSWRGRHFVTFAIGGIVVALGWQYEGYYRDWLAFPVTICRRRGR